MIYVPAENTYPALPVRAGENVIVSFSPEPLDLPIQQRLRLEPTAKSRVRYHGAWSAPVTLDPSAGQPL